MIDRLRSFSEMKDNISHITVIGDGGWGTTLAVYLIDRGFEVTLWGAFAENIQRIQETGFNKFLPGIKIPSTLQLTDHLQTAIGRADLVILAIPSQYLRGVLRQCRRFNWTGKVALSVIKGLDTRTLQRISQVIEEVLPQPIPLAVLSGPTIAGEVAHGIPSTAVVAAQQPQLAKRLQKILNSQTFRIYTNNDLVGIELGGSLKNVIALACGVCDGLGFGSNTKAAILTRGLVEMAELGQAMGAKRKTFAGLAGLGDLVTTCFSPHSRNRQVGEELGKGKSIETVLSGMQAVAEGVVTAKAVYKLSKKYAVPMPISVEVYNIIYKNKPPMQAVTDLMCRQIRAE
jgi:glycerol-3-phosphate dehydrogenase (NAD(P)+)